MCVLTFAFLSFDISILIHFQRKISNIVPAPPARQTIFNFLLLSASTASGLTLLRFEMALLNERK